MNRSIIGRLIAKDLYLYRWLITGSLIAGLASLVLSGSGGATGLAGQILFITTLVVLGVFLAMHGLLSERQSRSLLFVLSLPLSPTQYTVAKVAASLIAFLIPWTVLTGIIVANALALDATAGHALPATVTMMVFLLANFCVLLSIGLVTGSEIWAAVGIIGTNTAVPLFLGIALPAITGAATGWSTLLLMTLALELAVIGLSLGLAFLVQSRRRDHV